MTQGRHETCLRSHSRGLNSGPLVCLSPPLDPKLVRTDPCLSALPLYDRHIHRA